MRHSINTPENITTNNNARRETLALGARLRALSETERDLVRVVAEPGFDRWMEQIRNIGGCAHPIYLSGHTTVHDAASGEILKHFDTATEPNGRLAVRCRNRRETRCGPCSRIHAGDTYHLVRSGLSGGKGTPAVVGDHPRLFVTLTAPSFGKVHHLTEDGRQCLPRRNGGNCAHGRTVGCRLVHTEGDPLLGQPLCAGCYDYVGHVLWHAHAGKLWNRFCDRVRRVLATSMGIAQSKLRDHVRLSFAKVAEYQQRGAVHFHAVVRLDGPTGPDATPPRWATAELLESAVREAARPASVAAANGLSSGVSVVVPYSVAFGERVIAWGKQIDVHAIRSFGDGSPVTDDRVAAYVAKYTSKSVSQAGGTDRQIAAPEEIRYAATNAHIGALMATCWQLGGLVELEGLRLRAWAHTLGYRGHVLTKSRAYSTTYAALRADRAEYLRKEDSNNLDGRTGGIETDAAWRYVGSGHSPAAAELAAGIAEDLATARELAREERQVCAQRRCGE